MITYTIYWTPAQQANLMQHCPYLNYPQANWDGTYFELIQALAPPQHQEVLMLCQTQQIEGIKPGSNPGGSPNGCE